MLARLPGGRVALLVLAVALGLVSVLPGRAHAQSEPANLVVEIQFEGTVNTARGELLASILSRVGERVDARVVTRDVKALFALGFFRHVSAEVEEVPGRGVILRFVVVEKPRVVAVEIRGNRQITNKDLFEAMNVEVGAFYNRVFADANAEKIRGAYRNEGYLKVKVTPRTEIIDPLNLRLIYEVEESPRLYITTIRIRGTQVFSELELQRAMQSAEVDCFDWVNESGVFNEEKINQDLQVIVSRYLERGYIRVFIAKPKITLVHNPEFSRVIVELDITEGVQFFTGAQDITGDIIGDKQRLLDVLRIQTGNPHNAIEQTRDSFRLREVYQEQGYAFVQVRPDIRINDDTRTVDVTYAITRGEKAYIGRIEFQGNRETRDFVLRREFEVQENELYNGRRLRLSQQNLNALGYFTPGTLRIDTEPREVDNVLDTVTKLEEAQTGTLQAQIGFSDQSGATISTSVSKGNFLGRGQTIRGSVQWSQRGVTRNISLDFIEPHLFGSEYSSDSSVALRQIEDQTELDRGTFEEVFASQGVGHPIVGPLSVNLALSVLNRTFEDADQPEVRLRTFTTSLIYNTVNHPIFPSAGSNVVLAVSQVGGEVLGGTTEYRRYRLRAQRFFALDDDNSLIVMARARLGWLEQVGNNLIPPEDRFRLGGISTLRGYRFNEVGGPFGRLEQELNSVSRIAVDDLGQPILDSNGNPIFQDVDTRVIGLDESTLENLRGGGIQERLINLELLFPLAGQAIRGVVFYDAGQVNSEKVQYELLGEEEPEFLDLLHSIGTGVRMITPLGVFRFEYGLKLKVREGESPDQFDFTISTLF